MDRKWILMLVIEMSNATNDFMQEMLMGNFNLKYGMKVQKLRAWNKVSMATRMQSWETTKKDVMRAIQTTMETVKKHLMIQTYEFGNYP